MSELCRSCLTNNSKLINLTECLNNFDKITIFECFIYCTNLEIAENCFICLICLENLKIAFHFKKQCVESDLKLKEISFLNENQTELEDEESIYSEDNFETELPQTTAEECTICKAEILNGLESHMKESHCNKTNEYFCSSCDETFQNSFLLKSHFKTHLPEKQFKCSECEAVYSKSQILLSKLF